MVLVVPHSALDLAAVCPDYAHLPFQREIQLKDIS